MREMGYNFEVISPDIDEKAIRHKDPKVLALLIARAKNEAIVKKLSKDAIVVTSDQVVLVNNGVREKPISKDQAREFLRSYADNAPETVTAVVVANTKTGKSIEGVDVSKIYFRSIPEEVIDKLIQKGDVMFCAGGFMAEDPLLAPFVIKVEGSMDSVMGLPKLLTKKLIKGVSAR